MRVYIYSQPESIETNLVARKSRKVDLSNFIFGTMI